MKSYLSRLDIIGAEPETNRAILIRVKNAGELARSQGGVASFAQAVAPATIEARVYSEMAKKLQSSLKDQHVDADVQVVEPRGFVAADGKHVWTDIGFAIGGAGIFAALWYFFGRRK